jgi:uncharacterized iron-regulated membrane protein
MMSFDLVITPWLARAFPTAQASAPQVEFPSAGGRPNLQQAIDVARIALPGAEPRGVQAGGGFAPIRVYMRFPEDDNDLGRSTVTVSAITGDVSAVSSSRALSGAQRIVALEHAFHTGELYGMPMRIALSVCCLFVLLQTISGYYMWWWKKRKAASKSEARAASVEVVLQTAASD